MTISDWPNQLSTQVLDLTARLSASNDRELLQESLVDLELATEDRGWQRLGVESARDFSRRGLQAIATNCRGMAVRPPPSSAASH